MNTKAPSSPQDFKQKRQVGVNLELPSGLTIKVKGVDLVSLVVSGKIPNSLLTTVQSNLSGLEEGLDDEKAAAEFANKLSPDELAETFSVMDTLVMAMAMDPKIYPAPEDEGQRDDDSLYIDEVDGEDKLFMFNWSQKGLKQMERFPGQSPANVAPLEESRSTELPTGSDSGVGSAEL